MSMSNLRHSSGPTPNRPIRTALSHALNGCRAGAAHLDIRVLPKTPWVIRLRVVGYQHVGLGLTPTIRIFLFIL